MNIFIALLFLLSGINELVKFSSFRNSGLFVESGPNDLEDVTAVIFDMDGTLLDTESIMFHAFKNFLAQYKIEHTEENDKKLVGRTSAEGYVAFIEMYKLQDIAKNAEELKKLLNPFIENAFKNIKFKECAEEKVQALHDAGVPIAVATSCTKDEYELRAKNFPEFFKLFHHITTSDPPKIKKGKPAPYIFQESAKEFGKPVTPNQVLIFEDSEAGVEAADAANMKVIWIPETKSVDDKTSKKAFKMLKSLCDFKLNELTHFFTKN